MFGKYQDMALMQKQLNKQKLLQLQHQRNVCETIFSTVSSAEKVAMKLSEAKEYGNYDPINSASFKNENQLENELASKLVYCQCGLIAFNKQHGNFIFPGDKIKQEMINDIKKWSLLVKNRPKALESYKVLIELIEGNTVDIPDNCFHPTNFKSNEKSTLAWAEGMVKMQPKLDEQNRQVQEEYEQTGNATVPFKKKRRQPQPKPNFNSDYY